MGRYRASPAAVMVLSGAVVQIAAGGRHTCALLADGTVRCWGLDDGGQLGDGAVVHTECNPVGGPFDCSPTPITVPGLGGPIRQVAAGDSHTCALLTDGRARCWGMNGFGELGDGTMVAWETPTSVTGLTGMVTQLVASEGHTCALLADGTQSCWGVNFESEIGDGTTTTRAMPTPAVGLSGTVAQLAAGNWHTCAVLGDGTVLCWGRNASGEIGDGTRARRSTPVRVLW